MPYICLARSDIPDGTLQVTDLWPNTSLRNQSIDPPGQTRYFRRARNTPVNVSSVTGLATSSNGRPLEGLSAYLADRVEAGGLAAERQTLTILGGLPAGVTITIDGPNGAPVVFISVVGGANANNLEFNSVAGAGSPTASAASLVAAINAAVSQALLEISIGGAASGQTVTAANVGPIVTITADVRPGTNYLQTTLAESSAGVRVTLGGATLTRPATLWTTANVAAAANAILARVDAGQSLTLANINATLAGVVASTALSSAGGSRSTGTVLDILSILAGRSYVLPSGSALVNVGLLPLVVAKTAALGSFLDSVQVFDSRMLQGEIRPLLPFTKHPNQAASGGDTATPEHGPVRYSVDGDSLQASVLNGQLSRMQDSSVTLFPRNSAAFHGLAAFQNADVAQVNNARLVTVYADDGNLL